MELPLAENREEQQQPQRQVTSAWKRNDLFL
jgi:hypothetical protein